MTQVGGMNGTRRDVGDGPESFDGTSGCPENIKLSVAYQLPYQCRIPNDCS